LDDALAIAIIVAAAVGSQIVARAIRVPAIVPLLAAGVLLGPYVIDAFNPDELFGDLVDPMVELAVGVILFEGSLLLRREELSGAAGPVVARLVTVGFAITWTLSALAAAVLFDMETRMAILLGAVLSLSGPTVVLPLLEHIRPRPRVGAVLKWEGILIDPIGAIFAVLAFGAISTGASEFQPGPFLATVGVGIGIGVAAAVPAIIALRDSRMTSSLESSMLLALVLVAVAGASSIRDDAGLVAAIAMGVTLAHRREDIEREAHDFVTTLTSLLIGILFVVLSARVDPDRVADLGWEAIAFAAFLILAVRPLSAFIGTIRTGLGWNERGLIAWMMPRGIVAASTVSAFELSLAEQHVADHELLVPITFFVVTVTVLVYGLTARPLARALDVTEDSPDPR
jgi:NhaP-type Na+/H+ or K+/H+ antiporter